MPTASQKHFETEQLLPICCKNVNEYFYFIPCSYHLTGTTAHVKFTLVFIETVDSDNFNLSIDKIH